MWIVYSEDDSHEIPSLIFTEKLKKKKKKKNSNKGNRLSSVWLIMVNGYNSDRFCLCWGFMAQSTHLGHVKHSQFI